jgi:hypothetical protein
MVALQDAGVPTTVEHGGPEPLEADASRLMLAAVSQSPQRRDDGEQGVSIGEGLAPIPRKIAERIWRWEFVEMGDLLPENGMLRTEDGSSNPLGVMRRRRQITDVLTWVQCFAVYIGVMSRRYPEAVPELLAYMILIIRTSREFAELAWAQYDASYRRHAANVGNRQWSRINPSMYAVSFTGKAQASPRCELCASVFHLSRDCPFSTKTEMEKTLEAVLSACSNRAGGSGAPANPGSVVRESNEVCRKWNEERCNYQWCRYRHVCLECGGVHPVKHCPSERKRANPGPASQGQQSKRPRV